MQQEGPEVDVIMWSIAISAREKGKRRSRAWYRNPLRCIEEVESGMIALGGVMSLEV